MHRLTGTRIGLCGPLNRRGWGVAATVCVQGQTSNEGRAPSRRATRPPPTLPHTLLRSLCAPFVTMDPNLISLTKQRTLTKI